MFKKTNNINDNEDNFYANYMDVDDEYATDEKYLDNTENDYQGDNYYSSKDDKKLKNIFFVVAGTSVLAILLIVFLIIFFNRDDPNAPRIELLKKMIIVKVGEKADINYQIVNSKEGISASFKSKNSDIATVDDNGTVEGKKVGETTIIISYKSNNKNKETKCSVSVVK